MDIFPTMITPFKKDRTIDYDTAVKYVDWYFENGMTGIFSICQSSEIFFLTLEEKVKLNSVVYKRAKELEAKYGRPFTVVSSGHTSETIEDQAKELTAIWNSGTDALIFISNRLDPNNEGDDVFIANCEKLISLLPSDAKLGIYECPYPYKRLLTPRILKYFVETGRFAYTKDTCCDPKVLAERAEIIKGSTIKNLNANCQTLLDSMRSGNHGYCGIMANYHPKLYAWLCQNYEKYPKEAELIQSVLSTFGFTEVGLPYPLSAKYHMNLCGIDTELLCRNRQSGDLTEYGMHCVRQMKTVTDYFEQMIEKLQ